MSSFVLIRIPLFKRLWTVGDVVRAGFSRAFDPLKSIDRRLSPARDSSPGGSDRDGWIAG